MTNEQYQKFIDDHYKPYRGEWLELKGDVWHWRAQPFANINAAKLAVDKALIQKAEPKGTFEINWRKAI